MVRRLVQWLVLMCILTSTAHAGEVLWRYKAVVFSPWGTVDQKGLKSAQFFSLGDATQYIEQNFPEWKDIQFSQNQSDPNTPEQTKYLYTIPNQSHQGFYTVWNGTRYTGSSPDGVCQAIFPLAFSVPTNPPTVFRGAILTPDPRHNDPIWRFNCVAGVDGSTTQIVYSMAYPTCNPNFDYDPNVHACVNNRTAQIFGELLSGDCCQVGNPIAVSSRNKLQTETDYVGNGAFPLEFKRTYSSKSGSVQAVGMSWTHHFDRRIEAIVGLGYIARRPDNKQIWFTGGFVTDPDSNATLTATTDGYVLKLGNDDTETYDRNGRLLEIRRRDGRWHRLTYTNGQLTRVADEFGRALTFTYTTSGLLATVTQPDGGVLGYTYTNDLLTTVTYPGGATRTYVYGENVALSRLLTGIIDERGAHYATFTYEYSSDNAVSTEHAGGVNRYTLGYYSNAWFPVTDPLGTVIWYQFQKFYGVARPITLEKSCCNGGKQVTQMEYDANGNRTRVTDPQGNITIYGYDTNRNLEISRTEAYSTPQQRSISTVWHPTFRVPTQVIETGRTTDYSYNANGQLTQKTITGKDSNNVSKSQTWNYSYNAQGLLSQIDGPRTDVTDTTSYSYDSAGNVISITNALGHVSQLGNYDGNGRPRTITDPNGVATTLVYHPRGWITSKTTGGITTNYDYLPTGHLNRVTQADGSYIQYSYDNAQRLIGFSDSLGNRTSYTLDNAGNRTQEQVYDPNNQLRQSKGQVLDGLSRIIQELDAGNTAIAVHQYNGNDNIVSTTRPLHSPATQGFDALRRLISQIDPAGGTTQYSYDDKDRLTQVTDPNNHSTQYQYDGLGYVTKTTSPDSGISTATFDVAGNLLTKTDARGKTATHTYDALNRLAKTVYSDQTISYTYDTCTNGKGKLCKLTDASGNTTWSYDSLGRVSQKVQTVGTLTMTQTWTYDSYGRIAGIKYPSGAQITYSYNSNGQINSFSVNGQALISTTSYHPFGPIQGWTWGNGDNHIRLFDTNGRTSRIQGSDTNDYSYDSAHRIVQIAANDPKYTQIYGYNALDQLISVAVATGGPIPGQSYVYDKLGNRTSQTLGTTNSSFTIDTNSNKLLSATGGVVRSNTYDAAGNLTADGTRTYTYNSAGRPTTIKQGSTTLTLAYNGQGQRVSKKVGSTTTAFAYDETGHLIGEYSSAGALIQEVVWFGDLPIASLRAANTLASVDELPDMEPLRTADAGAVTATTVKAFYIEPDHLGTPRKAIDPATKKVIWRWDSDAYGTTLPNEDPDGNGKKFTLNLRFPGQYFDTETKLHYNYFRDYDPAIGRYVESDPIGLEGGLNTFVYVSGNPVSWVDPKGLVQGGGQVCESDYCRKVRRGCIADCSTNPPLGRGGRSNQGFPFFNCVNRCMQEKGC